VKTPGSINSPLCSPAHPLPPIMEAPRTSAKQQVVDRIPARIKHIQFGI
jgi:hypothetical protein